MIEHSDILQGTPEWLAYRKSHFNASDAPAMMGCSSYKTRSELLLEKYTGLAPTINAATQRIFDDGHRFEALARPLAEAIIGEELYPVVGSLDNYSASFDGLTMCEDIAFEHKTLSNTLRSEMFDGCTGADLPLMYRVQMEQQCLVSGCEAVLFMASKWDGETLIEERNCRYEPDLKLRAEIIAGWAQFEIDLALYIPSTVEVKPVATPVTDLPAVLVQVSGSISIVDNLPLFETALRDFLDNRLIRNPQNDQNFADLELQIKSMKKAETLLEAFEEHMFSQVPTVFQAKRTKDMLHKLLRDHRLTSEKLLVAEKTNLRNKILFAAQKALAAHIEGWNGRLGKPYMPAISANFVEAMKGKRSIASLQDAADTELARAKIDSSAKADMIQRNLLVLHELAAGHGFLFSDAAQIVLKANDDFRSLVENRIAAHTADEAQKEAAQREQIRAEELAKIERETVAIAAELVAKAARLEAEQAEALVVAELVPAPSTVVTFGNLLTTREQFNKTYGVPSKATSLPTLKLGQISERMGFTLTADFLKLLGFEPAASDRASKLYHEADFAHICAALVDHIQTAQAKQAA
jgi:putative phage-type endonuclease